MTRIRLIVRAVLLVAGVWLLVDLNRKTDDTLEEVVKFKLETLNKVKTDSLDTEHKLDLLVDETTKFSGDLLAKSPHLKNSVRYLIMLLVVVVLAELVFFIAEKRRISD